MNQKRPSGERRGVSPTCEPPVANTDFAWFLHVGLTPRRSPILSLVGASLLLFVFSGTTSVFPGPNSEEKIPKHLPLGTGIRCVAFSGDGALLAAGLGEPKQRGRVILWDGAGRKQLWSHEEGNGVSTVAFSPDRKT